MIALFDDDLVIDLPEAASAAAIPLRIESADDGVVVELPTDIDGEAIRLDVEQRVQALLTAR